MTDVQSLLLDAPETRQRIQDINNAESDAKCQIYAKLCQIFDDGIRDIMI